MPLSIEMIIDANNLEELYTQCLNGSIKEVNTDKSTTIRYIRQFAPIKYEIVRDFLTDNEIISELKRFGRNSILKNICKK
ncbi:hypothetical protein CWI38_0562p0060 [Hamiltosporidium tvaerminnensis]|uniref:Uncharacterized protein n=1 Tax=Hamiltosporidium tvaerminnensis TaxID=1176355 RepID=A0A4Q9KWW5_9MICR|nr:hypothetical protein CWI37_1453p0030 [Hamiltosporidium tvaerminnensis]TBU10442.1 hypothetical protein CWI38_1757p0030 [Hamiltosporidium tvaerminnensis]TBU13002.1 hypothetical protein CWI38_0562p0060 [Hamiltosporidium tvaerminnensis]